MKQILLTVSLLLSAPVFAQIAPPRQRIVLNLPTPASSPNVRIGPAMMLGGAALVVAGLLTPPIMVAGSTTQKQPIYKQIRMLPILSGAIVFTIGTGNTLTGN